ncbi:MAG: ureidoglycolate lyase [Planctomycetia bacterium]|nr:ureidoglycolate lyase [Planctomycetia bacterium]
MCNLLLNIKPLSTQAFKPFGEVLDISSCKSILINEGSCLKFDLHFSFADFDKTSNYRAKIYLAKKRHSPFSISSLENHPFVYQLFFPINNSPYIVIVAPLSPEPAIEQINAFYVPGNVGVVIKRKVWHHSLISLRDEGNFFVIENDIPGNCIIKPISQALELDLYSKLFE